MSSLLPPSPEVRAILKAFCEKQREKYGEDWKKILAKEMAEKTTPVLLALQKLVKK
jgi:hypothetical protein